ncbi:fungal-specific transcription factor domain-containing protein [Lipomyces oligophaga]|uniref:fungal-specific transcription factor domain-containing protein n=1 Tax=Lipomyces oligophaga TaxID=45792 RepID=UPI0034CE1C54
MTAMPVPHKGSQLGDKPKAKQSKSRNGCVTCKAKRLKCDETKPTCLQCQKRHVECGGYKRDFKWRLFEESSIVKRKKADTASSATEEFNPSFLAVSSTPNSTSSVPQLVVSNAPQIEAAPVSAPSSTSVSSASSAPIAAVSTTNATSPPISEEIIELPPHSTSQFDFSFQSSSLSPGAGFAPQISPGTIPPDSPYFSYTVLPSTIQSLGPGSTIPPSDLQFPPNTSPAEAFQAAYSHLLDESRIQQTDLSISSHPLSLLSPGLMLSTSRARHAELQAGSDKQNSEMTHDVDPTGPVRSSDVMLLPSMPSLDPFTRNALFFHTATASVMSMKDTPVDNPWRTLFWPLAQSHPALYHGLAAMSSFHAAAITPVYRIEAVDHMRLAIGQLVVGLNDNMPTDVALATTITLAFAEAWDRHISTGIAHLRGARILIRQFVASRRGLPESVQQSRMEQERMTRFKFLYNIWMYIAMIAKLTSDDEDETGGSVELEDENEVFSPNGFHTVDPLMGCAQTLFPIMGRVASLIRQVRLSGRDDIYVAGAIALKEELEDWQPLISTTLSLACDDPAYDTSSCIATAQAYKYATLLYLYQCVPSLAAISPPRRPSADEQYEPTSAVALELGNINSTDSPTKAITAKLLKMLYSVPTTSRTCVVHIFPLLSIACEVDSSQMRLIARQRWADLSRLLQMGNVDRAFDVIEEVWRRKDTSKGQWKWKTGMTHWSTVMREWQWEVLLG